MGLSPRWGCCPCAREDFHLLVKVDALVPGFWGLSDVLEVLGMGRIRGGLDGYGLSELKQAMSSAGSAAVEHVRS